MSLPMLSLGISAFFKLQLLFTLFCRLSCVTAYPGLNIDNDPAPSPEEGPPLSANASRDKRLLPYQITGLAGAYVIFAATALTVLLTVGRRLRRQALAGSNFYRVQMVQSHVNGTSLGVEAQEQYPSPISPIKQQQWESPTDSDVSYLYPSPVSPTTGAARSWVKPSGASHRTQGSANGSVNTFDDRVIEDDRMRAQTEMERLYAAVAVHEKDKERRHGATRSQTSSMQSSRQDRDRFSGLPTSPKPYQQNAPTSHLASPTQQTFSSAAPMQSLASPNQATFSAAQMNSMASPNHATFSHTTMSPRQEHFATQLASPTTFNFSQYQPPMSPNALSHPMAPTPVQNPLSPPLSPREPNSSRLSKANPLSFFSSRNRNSSGEKEPRIKESRISFKGLPISNPLSSPRMKNSIGVTTEERPLSPRMFNPGIPPSTSTGHPRSVNEIALMPTIPQSAEPSPQPQQQNIPSASMNKRTAPAPLTLGTSNMHTQIPTTSNSTTPKPTLGELPLRSYATSAGNSNPTPPQSAPYTRVQFADRRESRLNPGPKTGVPYPHSPYMPFSPVTPVSATIRTGKELKLAKKMAKMEEKEMVGNEDDIWGS